MIKTVIVPSKHSISVRHRPDRDLMPISDRHRPDVDNVFSFLENQCIYGHRHSDIGPIQTKSLISDRHRPDIVKFSSNIDTCFCDLKRYKISNMQCPTRKTISLISARCRSDVGVGLYFSQQCINYNYTEILTYLNFDSESTTGCFHFFFSNYWDFCNIL